jgi:signal transduction histidine kinase
MNPLLPRWTRRYSTALRRHQNVPSSASLRLALILGCQAVLMKLQPTELARIHRRTLTTLKTLKVPRSWSRQAESFLAVALAPLVAPLGSARPDKVQLSRLEATLDFLPTNRSGAEEISPFFPSAAKKNGMDSRPCLRKSLELQHQLRRLTHDVLAAQEVERHKISRELQDEIAQTLLGLSVRLLSLQKEARSPRKRLKDEIASTPRLVLQSTQSVREFAQKLENGV